MNAFYLNEAQYLAMNGRVGPMKELYSEYREKFPQFKDEQYYHTFRLLFTSACQFGKSEMAQWLYSEIYSKLTPEQQLSLKPTFNYCYNYAKKYPKFDHLTNWLVTGTGGCLT